MAFRRVAHTLGLCAVLILLRLLGNDIGIRDKPCTTPGSCNSTPLLIRLRSYLGYPPVRDAMPNTSHTAIAAGMHGSMFKRLITQNVDGLHVKTLKPFWDVPKIGNHILELHGTLFVCRYRTLAAAG